MPDPKKVTAVEVMEAVTAVRKTVEGLEAGKVTAADLKTVEENTEKTIKAYDDQNQKLVVDLAKADKGALEQKERLDELELTVSKQADQMGKADYKEGDHYKALVSYVRKGNGMDVESKGVLEEKTLRTDIDTLGGYRVSAEMDNAVIEAITEISPMRAIARVKTVGKKTLEMPTRTSIPTANYEGEAEAGTASEPTFGNETLTAHRLTAQVPFTMDQLMDDNFDLEGDIRSYVGEAMAFKEGNKFVVGTGAKQPEGVIVNTAVQAFARTTAGSGVISFIDLINVTGDLKTGYDPKWALNRKTLANIRGLQDGAGAFAWQPGHEVGGDLPATLLGDPYVLMPDMPDIAVGAYPVLYGDFMRGYTIIDRAGMIMIRDEITGALSAIIKVTFHKWNHGQVTLAEAFVPLKIKA